MACYHIKYTGGINPFSSNEKVYHCDFTGQSWDFDDAHVKHICKNGGAYRQCPIWKEYSW